MRLENLGEGCAVGVLVNAGGQFHGELMALSAIAHVCKATFAQQPVARREPDNLFGLGAQVSEAFVYGVCIELGEVRDLRMDGLIGDGRFQKA